MSRTIDSARLGVALRGGVAVVQRASGIRAAHLGHRRWRRRPRRSAVSEVGATTLCRNTLRRVDQWDGVLIGSRRCACDYDIGETWPGRSTRRGPQASPMSTCTSRSAPGRPARAWPHCSASARSGDRINVLTLDRLGRDMREAANLVNDLTGRGILPRTLGDKLAVDTSDPGPGTDMAIAPPAPARPRNRADCPPDGRRGSTPPGRGLPADPRRGDPRAGRRRTRRQPFHPVPGTERAPPSPRRTPLSDIPGVPGSVC